MWTFCAGCDIIIKIQIYMLKSGTPNTIGTSNKVNEVCYMTVSYKKLWKLLIDKDMTKADLRSATDIASSTLTKMSHNEYVSLDVLVRICCALDCELNEIVEIEHDK
jgi:putative transcriptional regulator